MGTLIFCILWSGKTLTPSLPWVVERLGLCEALLDTSQTGTGHRRCAKAGLELLLVEQEPLLGGHAVRIDERIEGRVAM